MKARRPQTRSDIKTAGLHRPLFVAGDDMSIGLELKARGRQLHRKGLGVPTVVLNTCRHVGLAPIFHEHERSPWNYTGARRRICHGTGHDSNDRSLSLCYTICYVSSVEL